MAFGILLILSIINFALAVPVLVHEERQPPVDVVYIQEDARTVLRKRTWEDDLAKVVEKLSKILEEPIESSPDTHASLSSAPPEPDHGSTNVGQAPPPNPASSTTNPDSLMKPPSLSLAKSMPGDRFKYPWDDEYLSQPEGGHNPLDPMSIPGSPGHGSDKKWTWAVNTPKSRPNALPMLSESADDIDRDFWVNAESSPRQSPAPPKELATYYLHSSQSGSTELDSDRDLMVAEQPYSLSGTKFHDEDQNVYPPSPPPRIYSHSDPGTPTPYSPRPTEYHPYSYPVTPKELAEDETVFGPQASPTSAADTSPNFQLDHQELSTNSPSQPVNLMDAIYKAKGKEKVSRRISGTARDVGNAAQRELQRPAEKEVA